MGSYSPIVTEIVARLTYHKASAGRILYGVKSFAPYPLEETEGLKDLPAIRIWIPDFHEQFRARTIPKASISLNVSVSTARKDGVPNLVAWVEKTLDALDVKADGSGDIDPMMNSTLRIPFSITSTPGMVHTNSITQLLTLSLVPRKSPLRGKRRL
jgi:hypothetical protein